MNRAHSTYLFNDSMIWFRLLCAHAAWSTQGAKKKIAVTWRQSRLPVWSGANRLLYGGKRTM